MWSEWFGFWFLLLQSFTPLDFMLACSLLPFFFHTCIAASFSPTDNFFSPKFLYLLLFWPQTSFHSHSPWSRCSNFQLHCLFLCFSSHNPPSSHLTSLAPSPAFLCLETSLSNLSCFALHLYLSMAIFHSSSPLHIHCMSSLPQALLSVGSV